MTQQQDNDFAGDQQDQTPHNDDSTKQYPDPLKSIIQNALQEQATDVYFNAVEKGLLILFRVDNAVQEKALFTAEQGTQLVNQAKVAAGIKATSLMKPEEGQIRWVSPDQHRHDIRVTMVPVKTKESAHLRFLSFKQQWWDLENLGMGQNDLAKVSSALNSLNGLILVTGITGSGKTTTMYSITAKQDLSKLAAYSVEDPIEFNLPYAQQMEVDEHQGFSMQQGLRTILRMSPDLIMIGEIRDKDSAITATRAAISGRLVLATLHAQDAAGAVDALHYLGVPYYIIGSSLRLIIAQNLVRKLCTACKQSRPIRDEQSRFFAEHGVEAPSHLYQARACPQCNDYGYKGQTGIFEIAPIVNDTAHMIVDGVHTMELRRHLRAKEIKSMTHDALEKVKEGITSMDELFRVLGDQPNPHQ